MLNIHDHFHGERGVVVTDDEPQPPTKQLAIAVHRSLLFRPDVAWVCRRGVPWMIEARVLGGYNSDGENP